MTHTKYQSPILRGLFNDFFVQPATQGRYQWPRPAANIAKTPTGFRVELALPGFAKEDLKVRVEQKHLIISAEKAQQEVATDETYQHQEFGSIAFERSFRLPDTIDTEHVEAVFEHGVLKISLVNKPEHQPVSKLVDIV
jgi:HSP20 family protein